MKDERGVVLWDGFPLTEGHSLVVPHEHVAGVFALPLERQRALWDLVGSARTQLVRWFAPDGFTIGINDGEAAGQTVVHAHIHVIPRRRGDVPDPRGGVRWIVPEKADYWKER